MILKHGGGAHRATPGHQYVMVNHSGFIHLSQPIRWAAATRNGKKVVSGMQTGPKQI